MAVKVTVELIGPARISAGRKEVNTTVEDGITWREVITALAQALPVLVGKAITKDQRDLIWPYMLSLGGGHTIQDLDEEARVEAGAHLVLIQETC